jgi:hypothetical protein
MKTLRWLFLLGVIVASLRAGAQAKLGITIDSFPQQLIVGDTTTHFGYFRLHNFGTDTFNGVFTLDYTVNGVFYNSADDSGLNFPSTPLIIAPNDSSPLQAVLVFSNTGPFSIVGSSGVVIWPISPSALTYDTAAVQTVVTPVAGITPVSDQTLKVFISQQQLFVNSNAQNFIKRVRVYDILGELLVESEASQSIIIPMNKYARGCYLAK